MYEEDGTTPLDLLTVTEAVVYLTTSEGEEITSYTYGTDANFVSAGETGAYYLKFDHADNADAYTGDVYLVVELTVTDAAFTSGTKVVRIGPEKIGTINIDAPEIPAVP